jgi:hypothetical protein
MTDRFHSFVRQWTVTLACVYRQVLVGGVYGVFLWGGHA